MDDTSVVNAILNSITKSIVILRRRITNQILANTLLKTSLGLLRRSVAPKPGLRAKRGGILKPLRRNKFGKEPENAAKLFQSDNFFALLSGRKESVKAFVEGSGIFEIKL